MVAQNINAMHAARKLFIQNESCDKLRRAMKHNIRGSDNVELGESVYYKRIDSNEWRGPGKVIGKDGQQVIIKHGGLFVRVHPTRLRAVRERSENPSAGNESEEDIEEASDVKMESDSNVSNDEDEVSRTVVTEMCSPTIEESEEVQDDLTQRVCNAKGFRSRKSKTATSRTAC